VFQALRKAPQRVTHREYRLYEGYKGVDDGGELVLTEIPWAMPSANMIEGTAEISRPLIVSDTSFGSDELLMIQ
jgi:hypothetical protein